MVRLLRQTGHLLLLRLRHHQRELAAVLVRQREPARRAPFKTGDRVIAHSRLAIRNRGVCHLLFETRLGG